MTNILGFLVFAVFISLPHTRGEKVDCSQITAQHSECLTNSYETYKKSVEAGDDGKENFHARKACEYLKMAVEDCGNLLIGSCYSMEDVRKQKDDQFKGIISQMEQTVKGWNSKSCPIIKDFLERQANAALKETKEEIKKKIEAVSKESKTAEILEKGTEVSNDVEGKAKKTMEDISNNALTDAKDDGPTAKLSEALIIFVIISLV